MDAEDMVSTEVGFAVAATAALMSPRARRFLRQGLVYGVAGALAAGEAVAGAAREAGGRAATVVHHDGNEPAQAEPMEATP